MAKATREAYGEALKKLAVTNPDIVVLDADLSGSTKTAEFKKVSPESSVLVKWKFGLLKLTVPLILINF